MILGVPRSVPTDLFCDLFQSDLFVSDLFPKRSVHAYPFLVVARLRTIDTTCERKQHVVIRLQLICFGSSCKGGWGVEAAAYLSSSPLDWNSNSDPRY